MIKRHDCSLPFLPATCPDLRTRRPLRGQGEAASFSSSPKTSFFSDLHLFVNMKAQPNSKRPQLSPPAREGSRQHRWHSGARRQHSPTSGSRSRSRRYRQTSREPFSSEKAQKRFPASKHLTPSPAGPQNPPLPWNLRSSTAAIRPLGWGAGPRALSPPSPRPSPRCPPPRHPAQGCRRPRCRTGEAPAPPVPHSPTAPASGRSAPLKGPQLLRGVSQSAVPLRPSPSPPLVAPANQGPRGASSSASALLLKEPAAPWALLGRCYRGEAPAAVFTRIIYIYAHTYKLYM